MVFAGEDAGHYYYRDFFCCDSSLLTTLHVLHLASSGRLAELVGSFAHEWRRPEREPSFGFGDQGTALDVCRRVALTALERHGEPAEITCERDAALLRRCTPEDVETCDGVRHGLRGLVVLRAPLGHRADSAPGPGGPQRRHAGRAHRGTERALSRVRSRTMKVLITGASGLLGSRLLRAFPSDWEVAGTCHSRPAPGLVQCSLTGARSVDAVDPQGGLRLGGALRRHPLARRLRRDPQRAMAVNAEGVRIVAAAAAASGARIAYASTDYVFPGSTPPYAERDTPAPLNVYGESKLAGEHHVLCVPRALVVRMPALYSLDLSAPNNLLGATKAALEEGGAVTADDHCVRYYTLAEDVAAAIAFLLQEGQAGVVHVSAHEAIHEAAFPAGRRRGDGPGPRLIGEAGSVGADRPLDSHLDTGHYESLGGPALTGSAWRLKDCGRDEGRCSFFVVR